MSPKTYFIGDLHLSHTNILNWSNFRRSYKFPDIDAHDGTVIELINTVVKPKDTLFILGDLSFRKESVPLIEFLHCRNVKLVLGNHDTYDSHVYLKSGIKRLYGAVGYKQAVLTHVPVHPCQLEFRWKANIHGHIHDPSEYPDVTNDRRYHNVNIDAMKSFFPVDYETLMEQMEE